MMGRAARNTDGVVVLYADEITESIGRSVEETRRRRALQMQYNEEHGITPKSIQKEVTNLLPEDLVQDGKLSRGTTGSSEKMAAYTHAELEKIMWDAVERLDFEKAATIRDALVSLEGKEWERVAVDTHSRSKRAQFKKHRR